MMEGREMRRQVKPPPLETKAPAPFGERTGAKYQIAAWCDGYNLSAPAPATAYLMQRYGLPRTLAGTVAQLAGIGERVI